MTSLNERRGESQTVSYSVGGSISGLDNGTVVIQNNGSDDLVVYEPGSSSSTISFNFPTKIPSGNAFNITVLVQPLLKPVPSTTAMGPYQGRSATCQSSVPLKVSV